jgi:xylulokinase
VPHILAVDLGTSGPKVALLTAEGDIVGHELEPTALHLSDGGGAEQDPDDWWRACTTAGRRLVERGLVPVDDIAAVAVTAQWLGTVPIDAGGKHLCDALIWMDSRGARHTRKAVGGPVRVQGYDVRKLRPFISRTGALPGLSGRDPIGHILWLRAERPDIYAATAKFLEPADYLNLRLTGRVVSSFDCIVAHWVTDNRDITNVRYDDRLLSMLGLERSKLPDLVPSATVVGDVTPEAADELGIRAGTKVVTATGDVHAAVVGSGALDDYAGHMYTGTSGWVTCHVPWKRTDLSHNMASLPAALPGRYFVANELHTAGACIQFLRDNVFLADDALGSGRGVDAFAAFDELIRSSAPGSGRVLFTPWLNGERSPVDDHHIRGGWHNVSLSTTRAQLVRAAYEGIGFNYKWLLGAVEKFIKRPMPSLNWIGGGALSDEWCQIMADVLDREIRRVAEPQQANVRGAAYLASIAMGYATIDELSRHTRIDATFLPDAANRAVYDGLFAEFKAIYKQNKAIHARLNRHG